MRFIDASPLHSRSRNLPWSDSVILRLRNFHSTQNLYTDIESLQQDRLKISVDSTDLHNPQTLPVVHPPSHLTALQPLSLFPSHANEISYKAQTPYKNAPPYRVCQLNRISKSSLPLHPSSSRPPSPLPTLLQAAVYAFTSVNG
jgi:hypothetical protein